jgi:hypothetical protein
MATTQIGVCRRKRDNWLGATAEVNAGNVVVLNLYGSDGTPMPPGVEPRSATSAVPTATASVGPLMPANYTFGNRRADSNHRFTTNVHVVKGMQAQGWLLEGAPMCAPGISDLL